VRELENAIERAVALAEGEVLEARDLPTAVLRASRDGSLREAVRRGHVGFEDAVGEFEKALIGEALERANGNQTQAARALGITRRVLKLKLDRFSLQPGAADASEPTDEG
jgi:two-component system response regulator HydG